MMLKLTRRFSAANFAYPSPARLAKDEKLTKQSIAKFMPIDKEFFKTLHAPFLHKDHTRILDLFGDHSLLVRSPLVESIEIIQDVQSVQAKMTHKIVPKILFHGEPGCGISSIMSTLNEYLTQMDHLVFAFPWMEGYLKRESDLSLSNEIHYEKNPHVSGDIFDFPERSAAWLRKFASQNKRVLDKHNPILSQDVIWSAKENSPKGTPLQEIIEFSSTRIKYSTDCIGIILREARHLANLSPTSPSFTLLLDGVNALWCRGTTMKDTKGRKLSVDNLALFMHLKRALRGDWTKGIIINAPNQRASWFTDREAFDPGYMLTKPGFETMNPFIPIKVDNMTREEFNQMLSFYAENNWLVRSSSHTEKARSEIEALSERNFKELFKVLSEF